MHACSCFSLAALQYIFNEILHDKKSNFVDRLKVDVLPYSKFPSGALFWDMAWRRKQPSRPAVVHNNFIVGPDNKRKRFREAGMWFVDEA